MTGDLDLIASFSRMHRFSNEKYEVFQKKWTQFDDPAIITGIFFSFCMLIFHIVVGLNWG